MEECQTSVSVSSLPSTLTFFPLGRNHSPLTEPAETVHFLEKLSAGHTPVLGITWSKRIQTDQKMQALALVAFISFLLPTALALQLFIWFDIC